MKGFRSNRTYLIWNLLYHSNTSGEILYFCTLNDMWTGSKPEVNRKWTGSISDFLKVKNQFKPDVITVVVLLLYYHSNTTAEILFSAQWHMSSFLVCHILLPKGYFSLQPCEQWFELALSLLLPKHSPARTCSLILLLLKKV